MQFQHAHSLIRCVLWEQVYKGVMHDVQLVAVKQLKQHDARNDIRFLREIAILKECRSPHVVQFLVSVGQCMECVKSRRTALGQSESFRCCHLDDEIASEKEAKWLGYLLTQPAWFFLGNPFLE